MPRVYGRVPIRLRIATSDGPATWRKPPKIPRQAGHPPCDCRARSRRAYHGFVNPPVYHASTVLYPTAEDQVAHRARYQYGRRGTPTTEALEDALRELEGDGMRRRRAAAVGAGGDLDRAAVGR